MPSKYAFLSLVLGAFSLFIGVVSLYFAATDRWLLSDDATLGESYAGFELPRLVDGEANLPTTIQAVIPNLSGFYNNWNGLQFNLRFFNFGLNLVIPISVEVLLRNDMQVLEHFTSSYIFAGKMKETDYFQVPEGANILEICVTYQLTDHRFAIFDAYAFLKFLESPQGDALPINFRETKIVDNSNYCSKVFEKRIRRRNL
ncbi:hypothetical protein [Tropicimonas sp. S265A]|uniref:hypothetical protein n=1 Tax=Tropicimonas sp. S265A TaxID=3415134 RepID=UPI003C7DDDBF